MNHQRGLGSIAISVKGNLMTLSDGLHLESKLPIDDRITAERLEIDGIAGWALMVGDLPHWVRLRVEIGEGTDSPDLVAFRLLFRVERDEGLESSRLRAMLARVQPGKHHRAAVPRTAVDLSVERSGIYALTGLFAHYSMDEGCLELLVNLPCKCKVSVYSVDILHQAADFNPAARERIAANGAETIIPFALSAINLASVAAAVEAPVVLMQDVALSGLYLTGHVVALPHMPQVRIVSDKQTHLLPIDRPIQIGEGIYLPCGFRFSLLDLGGHDSSDLDLYLELSLDAPFRTINIPPHLLTILQALQGVTVRPKDLPSLGMSELFFFPNYTETNPYQTLMYRSMPQTVARPGTLQDAISRLESGAPPGSVIMHLHWLHVLLAGSATEAEARVKHRAFRGLLRHFIRLGGVLLWTVHNTVSHDAKYREIEIKLSQDVAHLASRIHVHSESLLSTLAECYDLPTTKLVIEPHPNYVGYYLNYCTREGARNRFDLPQHAKVVLFVGQLRPYKGIESLAQAFMQIAASNPDAWLLIAGKPVHPYVPGTLTRLLQSYPNVRVMEGFIPDNDLQWFYRAADWVALPYTNILTSGSLLCAMSFSRPCIAPRLGMIGDVVEHGHNGLLYDPEDPRGLVSALAAALAIGQDQLAHMQAAALATVEPLSWDRMGQGLMTACEQVRHVRSVPLTFESGILDCQLLGPAFPPEKPARTAVIILHYEHIDDVQRLVRSLRVSDNRDFDVYIVDNASPSLTPVELAHDFDGLRVLFIPENLGYAAGNNAALRLIADMPYEFVWILNPDVVVPPRALDGHLAAASAHPSYDIFGPVILRGADDRQIDSAGCFISFEGRTMVTGHMYAGEVLEIVPATPFEADFITGASIFLRKSVLEKIGFIPEDYFLYFEETQWLLEARKKGIKCLVLPDVTVAHYKRSEEDALPTKYYFYYYLRNALIFYSRMTARDPACFRNSLFSGFVTNWLQKIEARRPEELELYRRLAERALADGTAGRTGRVDLHALEFDLLNPSQGATPFQGRSKFTLDADGNLSGIICIVGERLPEAVVTVLADDRVVGSYQCQLDQEEHNIQQWSTSLKLPSAYHRDASFQLECRLNGQPLQGGRLQAFLPRLPPAYQGRIDGIANFFCAGWALNKHDFDEKVEVEIVFEDRVVARVVADMLRPDLQKNGIGDGAAGFRVRMPRIFSDGHQRRIHLRIAGTGETLFERECKDGAIAGGALPRPIAVASDDLFYDRHLWLARHGMTELPLGQLESTARAILAARHANRHESELVSVIMPAFNRERTILQAVASVRVQSYTNWELVIADDGSSDRTVEVVEDFIRQTGDVRIRLIVLPENRGVSAARNFALHAARGEIIAYLDSDNVWLPDFLRIMTGELMCRPKPGSAYCGQNIFHIGGVPEAPFEEMIALRMAPFHLPLLENRNYIDLNCFIHHRRLYDTLGGFAERLHRLVDWELILRYARMETPHFVPALLTNYYFDNAENQITKLESFKDNMRVFNELASRHARKPVPALKPRPVDIALIGAPGQELASLVQRAEAILTALDKHDPVRLLLCPAAEIRTDAGALLPLIAELVACPASEDGAKKSAVLSTVLRHRRLDADLVVMQGRTMPQPGWLQHFNAAVAACPLGGIFISRHMILAQKVHQHVKQIPFAHALRDACIALPADERIVLDPQLDPEMNLVEISHADLFCTYIKHDHASELHALSAEVCDDNVKLALLSQLLRQIHRRKIVYCGDVEVYEL